MSDLPEGAFALSSIKGELDAALIQLETKYGLTHANPDLVKVREAGDRLFSSAIHRKFSALVAEPHLSYRELVEQGGLRKGAELIR